MYLGTSKFFTVIPRNMIKQMKFLFYLLLYQASSRSKINRKFLSSGRLNCSHWISPGSFSWRTNFLLFSGSFIHKTANISGFSSSFSRLSLSLDKDLDLGKLKKFCLDFAVVDLSISHWRVFRNEKLKGWPFLEYDRGFVGPCVAS